MKKIVQTASDWVPQVRRLRPHMALGGCPADHQCPLPHSQQWTQPRLLRAVRAYIHDGFLPPEVLGRAGRRVGGDRLPAIVAALRGGDPQIICDRLEAMRERTPRGRTTWQPSSVRMLLVKAAKLGMLSPPVPG